MSASVALPLPPEPRRSPKLLLQRWALRLAALLIAAWSLGPFLWQFITAFQPDAQLMASPPHILPWPGTLEHFHNIFAVKHFQILYPATRRSWRWRRRQSASSSALLAAYALARFNLRGRFGILGLILSVSMFPQIAIVAPLYLLDVEHRAARHLQRAGRSSTWRLAFPSSSGCSSAISGRFRANSTRRPRSTVPARSASSCRSSCRSSLPGVVTTGLLAFIAAWNEFMFALSFTSGIEAPDDPGRHRQLPEPLLRALGRRGGRLGRRDGAARAPRAGLPAPHHRRPHPGSRQGMSTDWPHRYMPWPGCCPSWGVWHGRRCAASASASTPTSASSRRMPC